MHPRVQTPRSMHHIKVTTTARRALRHHSHSHIRSRVPRINYNSSEHLHCVVGCDAFRVDRRCACNRRRLIMRSLLSVCNRRMLIMRSSYSHCGPSPPLDFLPESSLGRSARLLKFRSTPHPQSTSPSTPLPPSPPLSLLPPLRTTRANLPGWTNCSAFIGTVVNARSSARRILSAIIAECRSDASASYGICDTWTDHNNRTATSTASRHDPRPPSHTRTVACHV